MKKRVGQKGLTLTELLVVLAIVGILGLITVPSFVRFYFDSTDRVKLTSRELMQILQVARMYAMTYRVNTAVVYSTEVVPVETNVVMPNGEPGVGTKSTFMAIKSAGLMYEISTKNNEYFYGIKRRLGIPDNINWDSFYVPVEPTRVEWGTSQEFPSAVVMCFYREENFSGGWIPMVYGINEINPYESIGLSSIYVPLMYLEGKPHAEEKYLDLLERNELDNYTKWYAHVFSPSGKLLTGGPVKERYTFALVDVSRREPLLVRRDDGSYVEDLQLIEHKKNILELYRSTGVVKVVR